MFLVVSLLFLVAVATIVVRLIFINPYYPEPGVRIASTGRDEFKYEAAGYSVNIIAYLLTKDVDYEVHSRSFVNWLSPHEDELVSEEDRKRIIRCLCSWLDHWGKTYVVT
jgi:hypothetical protein